MENPLNTLLKSLNSEFLMEVRAELSMQIIGDTPYGHRRIYHITGGYVKGLNIEGEILPGGGDGFLIRPDGTARCTAQPCRALRNWREAGQCWQRPFAGGAWCVSSCRS